MNDRKQDQASKPAGTERRAAPPARQEPAPVTVAVGASAASTDALERFFGSLAALRDYAIVCVLQHREALSEKRLQQALHARPDLQFSPVRNGAPIQTGSIYVPDPDVITTVKNGRFRIRKAQHPGGARGTIDSFFISLAQDQGERAVGVVLHGTAADGTLGVAAIKEEGGLTIAESGPGESAMELAAGTSAGALADFLLPAAAIAERIAIHVRHLNNLREHKDVETMRAEVSASLDSIANFLRNKTGHDFHGYKQNTFLRRVQRRMQVVQADEIGRYVEVLRDNPNEVQNLFNDLLIGVTQFFRDAKEFELLETQVVPKLFEGKRSGDQLRVWVLGCATGEEAYSIAILLREHMAKLDEAPSTQIFATDIDGRALAAARVGRYMESIAADISPARLARWFVKEGNTYCIVKELREMCIFSAHNLIKDAPFSRLDLISCRNLLIYLNRELQDRVIPLFHFALLPGGFLFLGNSEHVTRQPKLFEPVDRRSRIFRRIDTARRVLPDFPIVRSGRVTTDLPSLPRPRPLEGNLARRAERIAERYAPAYVVTDEDYQVLHFSGRTGRYLEPSAGTASLELFNLIHRDLRLDLRAGLNKAAETDERVDIDHVPIGGDGATALVDIVVEPVRDEQGRRRNFVVVFKEGVLRPDAAAAPDQAGELRNEHVARLESELRFTRDRLQATIEELESTNEELKSSNEEYQSLNEELQSANEELETSKEELQSVNEELTTVNGELAHRVQELTRATSDLKNFLESTQIATIFLDNDLRVMNFTPAVTELFHLVETDVGRPLAHIKARISCEELQDDAKRVLRTLGNVEREIENPAAGTRYIVRVLPSRSVDNFIAGVVVTFVDVTPITRAEERQRLLLAELQHRVRNTLGVIRSISRRTAESSETVDDFAMHLEGRLDALARVQAAVTRSPAAGVDLEYLVAEELLVYEAHEGEQVTSIKGPPIRLQPKAAENLALAVHELATNAVKHGALAKPSGRVDVSWRVQPDGEGPRLIFRWIESGLKLDGTGPRRRGFGTELLERTLAYELKAKTSLDFDKAGLRCTLEVPLTPRILAAEDTRR